MPSLVIKNLPPEIHRRLKAEAARNHRSMTKQAIAELESGPLRIKPVQEFKPYGIDLKINDKWLNAAKRWGRK
jgi:plasmid stability protein